MRRRCGEAFAGVGNANNRLAPSDDQPGATAETDPPVCLVLSAWVAKVCDGRICSCNAAVGQRVAPAPPAREGKILVSVLMPAGNLVVCYALSSYHHMQHSIPSVPTIRVRCF